MIVTAGIDAGSTYTKAVLLDDGGIILGKAITKTAFRFSEAATRAHEQALSEAGLVADDVRYIVSTGYGRYLIPFRDTQVTDLTAQGRGTRFFFPHTRTVLDIGGQTMKASRLDDMGRVRSFRLNDKCAAGTGAFLEKTAAYLGYRIEEIGPLVATSKESVAISSVCAVFAESEVINHVSAGYSAADILHGAIVSLADRSVQLMKRVGMEAEFTLVGGILRFKTMSQVLCERLNTSANVPPGDLAQCTGAVGAALLAQRRLHKLQQDPQASALPALDAGVSVS